MSGRLDHAKAKRQIRGRRGEPAERQNARALADSRWRTEYPVQFPVTVTRLPKAGS